MGVIVLGYVDKPEGHAALAGAIEEARRRAADLVVVNNTEGQHPEAAALKPVRRQLEEAGIQHEVVALQGRFDPAEELLSLADERKAELIVIGLRRRSPLGKLLLGSNAQRILLDAVCPVLAVKAES